ncbi:hypothetical protein AcV5_001339 [Taiwanofungus camphoratus]|nr:hypothetical protein AcV5_001339 [Antrodia cinnamomea]KAI0941293.1 hypothetical protein AcV7_002905 [Antrodia cinnamomea]
MTEEPPVGARRSARVRPSAIRLPANRKKASTVSPYKSDLGKRRHLRIKASADVEPHPVVPEPTRRRHRRGPRAQLRSSDHHSMPSSMALASALPPSSPARELLRRAQQTAEVDTDWLGRRPFVMDVILNAMPPVSEYSEDIVMEALERSQAVFPRDDYVFDDQESLERYWADHAALWRGVAVQPAHYPSSKRYQVSAERSTASWTTDTEGNSSQLDDGRYCISAGATLPPSNI